MAGEGEVIACHSVEIFKEQMVKATESKKLVVIDFTASWCPPCRMIAPIFVELAKKFVHVVFLKVDVDELKAVAEEYDVEAMPTFVFVKEGQQVDRMVGAKKDDLPVMITKHAGAPAASTAAAASTATATA